MIINTKPRFLACIYALTLLISFLYFPNLKGQYLKDAFTPNLSQPYDIREFSYRTGLPAQKVYFVTSDKKGFWYFGTSLGIYWFNGYTFELYFKKVKGELDYSRSTVRNALFDDSFLYFTSPGFLNKMHISSQKLVYRVAIVGESKLLELNNGKVTLITDAGGAYYLNASNFKSLKHYAMNNIWYGCRIQEKLLVIKTNGELYVLNQENGFTYLQKSNLKYPDIQCYVNLDGSISGIGDLNNYIIYGDSNQNVNRIITNYFVKNRIYSSKFMASLRFLNVHKDNNSFIWFTTEQGVFWLNKKSFSTRIDLVNESIRGMYIKNNFHLISTYTGYYLKKPYEQKYQLLQTPKTLISWDFIGAKKANLVYALTSGSGLMEIDLITGKNSKVSFIPDNLNVNTAVKITDSRFYLFGDGVYFVDFEKKEFRNIINLQKSLGNIYKALSIGASKFLLATAKGIAVYDLSNNSIRILEHVECRWLTQIRNGNILAGTLGSGLFEFDKKTQSLHNLSNGNAELSRTFFFSGIALPYTNDVWIGSPTGLFKFNYQTKTLHVINTGIREFNSAAALFSGDSMLYMGGVNGLEIFNLNKYNKINTVKQIAPPIFYGLRKYVANLGFQLINLEANRGILELNSNDLMVELNISSALSLTQQVTRYRYRIIGYSKYWIPIITEQNEKAVIAFTKLPSGRFKLECQVQYENGLWSPSLILPIESLPEWYRRWYVILAFVTILCLVTFFIIRLYFSNREKSIKKDNQISEFNRKILGSELKALRSQLDPHHFANSMQTVQYFIYNNEKEKAADYLSKYSTHMRQIFENSMHEFVSLQQETSFLRVYAELETIRTNNNIEILIDLGNVQTPTNILVPSMIIQPFVENAFKHGFKNFRSDKNNPLMLKILFKLQHDNTIHCSVFNNGNPMNDDSLKKSPSGNEVTSARLAIYGEMLQVDSWFTYRKVENGTIVDIIMPFKQL